MQGIVNPSSTLSDHSCLYGQLALYHTIPTFNDLKKKALENIVEKGENAGKQYFLLLRQCFLLYKEKNPKFSNI